MIFLDFLSENGFRTVDFQSILLSCETDFNLTMISVIFKICLWFLK